MTDKIRSYMGLCRAAGGVTTGTDLIFGEIRKNNAKFVVVASDASDRTVKQIRNKCEYYKVKYYMANYTQGQLAELLGKKAFCAAAAFTGKGPCAILKSALDELESQRKIQCADGVAASTIDTTERMIVNGNKADTDVQD